MVSSLCLKNLSNKKHILIYNTYVFFLFMNFIDKIKTSPPAIGTLVTLESSEIAEIFSQAGFDWLFFDMEHGVLSPSSVQHLIQASRQMSVRRFSAFTYLQYS